MDFPHQGPRFNPHHSIITALSHRKQDNDFSGDTKSPHRSPLTEKIQNGLTFSRVFVLSYNVVLILVLVVIALIRNYQTSRRKQRQRTRVRKATEENNEDPSQHLRVKPSQRGDGDSSSSESNSTITGTTTPPSVKDIDNVPDERTRLLPQPNRKGPKFQATLRAFLMYQPRPVPVVNRRLPGNATTVAILAFYCLNVFYCLFHIPFDGTAILFLADRFGLLFAANLPLLYFLAAKNQPIKRMTGYSYESLNIFHRRVGEMICFFALLHMAGMFTVWYTLLRPLLNLTFWHFISERLVILGLSAFVSYQLLYLTSLGSFRQRWYELFLASHILLQLAAGVFLWFHFITTRIYVGPSFIVFCIDRIVYRWLLKSQVLEATVTVMEDGETVLLSSNWAIHNRKNRSIISGWKPTDHVFLSIPTFSWQDNLQSHPFTIASAPPNVATSDAHAWLSLLIRAKDGFSRRLLDYAHQRSTLKVRLDGPYGSTHPLDTLRDSDLAIVVAGGSGIAVAYPLIYALLDPHCDQGNGETTSSVSLERNSRRVCLVWIVHSRSHLSWLPQERLDELKEWGLELCIPPPTVDGGRPDIAEIVQDLVYQHQGRERAAVVVSGPDEMNRDVRNACSCLVQDGKDVTVEVEKFGW
jgi:NAD(P)H-flavin reductase